jgi:hypothetical protein
LIEEGLLFLGKNFPNPAGFEIAFQPKKSSKSDSCDIPKVFRRLASELLVCPVRGGERGKTPLTLMVSLWFLERTGFPRQQVPVVKSQIWILRFE